MKVPARTLALTLLVVLVSGSVGTVFANKEEIYGFNCQFESISVDHRSLVVSIEATFSRKFPDDNKAAEVDVTLLSKRGVTLIGETDWKVLLEDTLPKSLVFDAQLANNDTCRLVFKISCCRDNHSCYFVTTGDTVEFWGNSYPRVYLPRQPRRYAEEAKIPLTAEELATEYDVRIDLRDSVDLRIAEKLLGKIAPDGKLGFYQLRSSLETLVNLYDKGIGFQYLKETPRSWWDSPDSSSERKKDSLKPQGSSHPPRSPSSLPGISLDTVLGLIDPTTLSHFNGRIVSN